MGGGFQLTDAPSTGDETATIVPVEADAGNTTGPATRTNVVKKGEGEKEHQAKPQSINEEWEDDNPNDAPHTSGAAGARRANRRRSQPSTKPYRGRPAGSKPAGTQRADIAWDASLRAAAPHQFARKDDGLALSVRPDELATRRRVVPQRRLVLFIVDTSGSVVTRVLALAQKLVAAVLESAYLQRDRVAVIAFEKDRPRLVVEPTDQIEHVARLVGNLPRGGYTPLGSALDLAHRTLVRESNRDAGNRPILALITDARANYDSNGKPDHAVEEVELGAKRLMTIEGLQVLFVDTTKPRKNDTPARRLANFLETERLCVGELLRSDKDPVDTLRTFMAALHA